MIISGAFEKKPAFAITLSCTLSEVYETVQLISRGPRTTTTSTAELLVTAVNERQ